MRPAGWLIAAWPRHGARTCRSVRLAHGTLSIGRQCILAREACPAGTTTLCRDLRGTTSRPLDYE